MGEADPNTPIMNFKNPKFVWLMSVAHGMNEFFGILVPPLFPFLVPDLGISYTETSYLIVAFYATFSGFQLVVGRIADVYDQRRLLVWGQVGLAAGIATVAFSDSFLHMLIGMALAGVGGSTYHPTGMSALSDFESESTHGQSMGVHGMAGIAGGIVSPITMSVLASELGWRWALLIGSFIGVFFAAVLFVAYPAAKPDEKTPNRDNGLAEVVRSEFSGSIDAAISRTTRSIRSPTTLTLILLFGLAGAEVRAVQVFIPVFASELVGGDPAFGNTMLSITMVASGFASVVTGYAVNLIDRRILGSCSFAATAVVVTVLVFLSVPRLVLIPLFVVLGVVLYAVFPVVNVIAAEVSTPSQSGSLFGVVQTAASIGAAIGPFIVGVVADTTTLRMGFLATIGVGLLGIPVLIVADS